MNNEQLKQFEIFEDLTDNQINQFHGALKSVEMEKGEQFITEGEEGDCIFLLLSGEVEINQALTLSRSQMLKEIPASLSLSYPIFLILPVLLM